jgi:hypothetical protein
VTAAYGSRAAPLHARRDGLKVLVYTRHDACGRRLVNPDAVRGQVLTWCGHARLVCSVTVLARWPLGSFRAQVALLADVGMLVTPHGAALVNALFLRRGAAVVEVSDAATRVGGTAHGAMADALGLQHCLASAPAPGHCGLSDAHCTLGHRELAACLNTFYFPLRV